MRLIALDRTLLLDSTICWQRTEERHFQSFVATQPGLSKRAVSVAVIALRDAGLIDGVTS